MPPITRSSNKVSVSSPRGPGSGPCCGVYPGAQSNRENVAGMAAAITASAKAFMTSLPDMIVAMDSLRMDGRAGRCVDGGAGVPQCLVQALPPCNRSNVGLRTSPNDQARGRRRLPSANK